MTFTVLLSVLLHGITARPGGRRYVEPNSPARPRAAPAAGAARSRPTIGERDARPMQTGTAPSADQDGDVSAAIDRRLAGRQGAHRRIDPDQAGAAAGHRQPLLVDTRPAFQRLAFGVVPGAIVVERNHLEWRLDPTSEHRPAPTAIGHRGPIVVFCQEGYASSLAVESLQDLGVVDVHDLVGGFAAWAAAGQPTADDESLS